uniref:Hexosyltransferase n=1 Tax=Macaca fascicularis TaxID=9541 RepID=A0A7N9CI34_MACFA
MPRLPVKKIRKQMKLLLLLLLLSCAAWLTYVHLGLVRQGRALRQRLGYGRDGEKLTSVTDGRGVHAAPSTQRAEDSSESREEEQAPEGQDLDMLFPAGAGKLPLNFTHQTPPWREEYKGQVNLHVFEDWCGGAVGHLRRNLHFPLFPHTRTTVKKLAVSPKWKNYGLRIFGFIHPARDGDVQFSVASDDNSEFWLSPDESPAAAQLVAFVGKVPPPHPWCLPRPPAAQSPVPTSLLGMRTRWVWCPQGDSEPPRRPSPITPQTGSEWTAPGEFTKFSSQVSKPRRLMASRRYYFELLHKQDDRGSDHVEVGWRAFLPGLKFEVISSAHISLYTDESALKMDHVAHVPQSPASHVGGRLPQEDTSADMLRPDPRDTFFLTPRMESSSLENVLEPCAYAPTYVVKDFPIARYQGLQFVYLSFVYPNDYTRLTHMETDNKCFYRESPLYLERFGFYKYMKMDKEEGDEDEEEEVQRRAFLFLNPDDFLDDEDEGELLDSLEPTEAAPSRSCPRPPQRSTLSPEPPCSANPSRLDEGPQALPALSWASGLPPCSFLGELAPPLCSEQQPPKVYVTRVRPGQRASPGPAKALAAFPAPSCTPGLCPECSWAPHAHPGPTAAGTGGPQATQPRPQPGRRPPKGPGGPGAHAGTCGAHSGLKLVFRSAARDLLPELVPGVRATAARGGRRGGGRGGRWGPGRRGCAGGQRGGRGPGASDAGVRTPSTGSARSAGCGLRAAALGLERPAVQRLGEPSATGGGGCGRGGSVHGAAQRASRRALRASTHCERGEAPGLGARESLPAGAGAAGAWGRPPLSSAPAAARSPRGGCRQRKSRARSRGLCAPDGRPELCRPLRLAWRQDVMVHFIVPVKNQARWVAQFLADMAALHARTGDSRFSVVLVDFESEDMDVERALRTARLPRYQYLRRTGNFERSAGLQAGVDAVEDASSIVFLCDLHIHFPPNILDGIRKHCVEGRLAFAPVVMRLSCGSSPRDPHGYWEVNGFGLFGIYKSDFDRVGGMNTEEFRDQWGGEDWELLDRVLQAGLEVERLRLRNFYHHYHSKRGMWSVRSRKGSHTGAS